MSYGSWQIKDYNSRGFFQLISRFQENVPVLGLLDCSNVDVVYCRPIARWVSPSLSVPPALSGNMEAIPGSNGPVMEGYGCIELVLCNRWLSAASNVKEGVYTKYFGELLISPAY